MDINLSNGFYMYIVYLIYHTLTYVIFPMYVLDYLINGFYMTGNEQINELLLT